VVVVAAMAARGEMEQRLSKFCGVFALALSPDELRPN
jgi:hypothetical protein